MNINYKSDFPLRFRPVDDDGQPLSLPSCPWQIWLTVGNPFSLGSDKFIASFDGTNFSNCRVADGTVLVFANNHGLPTGRLWVTFLSLKPDNDFPDGTMRVYSPRPTDITLVSGAGDSVPDAAIDVVANYLPVPYDDSALSARVNAVENQLNSLPTPLPIPLVSFSVCGYGDNNDMARAETKGHNTIHYDTHDTSYDYEPFDKLVVKIGSEGFNPNTDFARIFRFGTRKTRIGRKDSGFIKKSKRGWSTIKYPVRAGANANSAKAVLIPVYRTTDEYMVKIYPADENVLPIPTPIWLANFIDENYLNYWTDGEGIHLKMSHLGKTKKIDVSSGASSLKAQYGIALFRYVQVEPHKYVAKRISDIVPFKVIITIDDDENVWIRFR